MTLAERIEAFPRGCRVQLSPAGRARGGAFTRAATGTVVGHSRQFDAIAVLRDGRKTSIMTWWGFWERVDGNAERSQALPLEVV